MSSCKCVLMVIAVALLAIAAAGRGGRHRGGHGGRGGQVCVADYSLPTSICGVEYADGSEYTDAIVTECTTSRLLTYYGYTTVCNDLDPADGQVVLDSAGDAVRVYRCSRISPTGTVYTPGYKTKNVQESTACLVLDSEGNIAKEDLTLCGDAGDVCTGGPFTVVADDDSTVVLGTGYVCCTPGSRVSCSGTYNGNRWDNTDSDTADPSRRRNSDSSSSSDDDDDL